VIVLAKPRPSVQQPLTFFRNRSPWSQLVPKNRPNEQYPKSPRSAAFRPQTKRNQTGKSPPSSSPITLTATAFPPAPSILSNAFSSSSLFTSTLTPLAAAFFPFAGVFLPPFLTGISSSPSSLPAALAFFGVLLTFLLGVLLSTPPAGAAPAASLVRLREFQRARREPLFL
jgi:hypothetical protein